MGCCCWSPPYVKLKSTAISLFVFCLIVISLSITNFCLQWTRNSCGYCEYVDVPEPIITTLEPTTREESSGDGSGWSYEPIKVDLEVNYKGISKSYILKCDETNNNIYDEMHDYLACNDYCNGRSYWLDGVWGTFFALIASIIAWAGSCKKIPETFTVLYRVQATFATIGMITALVVLGLDITILVSTGSYLVSYCTDILAVWVSEIICVFIVLINTIVASGRLGCCCVVGCPNNSISPVNSIEDRTVEIDSDSDGEESVA